MTLQYFQLTARDPLVARDGRPFGADQGNRMRSLPWLYPGTVAGSFRTALAKSAGKEFGSPTNDELLQLAVAGVFPLRGEVLYLPAPNDCVVGGGPKFLRARPEKPRESEGARWPADELWPVMLAEEEAEEDFKPLDGPAFWTLERYAAWIIGQRMDFQDETDFAPAVIEQREHVQLRAESGAAEEGRLFGTAGLHLARLKPMTMKDARPEPRKKAEEVQLAMRATVPNGHWAAGAVGSMAMWHPLGGERRLVHWQAAGGPAWECPGKVRDALQGVGQIRMTLATPAIFRAGWRPGWLDHGKPFPDVPDCPVLKLVGVCTQRWKAVSGWSTAALNSTGKPGPKPIKRLVPAGGVYFFTVESGSAAALADRWLHSVCDDEQDGRDGFGLATWGTWQTFSQESNRAQ